MKTLSIHRPFGRANPHVTVSLAYMGAQGQKLALANDAIDVGFLIGPFQYSDVESLLLSFELIYVVAPKRHPLMKRRALAPADLANVPIILGDVREWGEYRWRLTDLFNSEGVALNVRLEASTTLALIGLVAAGL